MFLKAVKGGCLNSEEPQSGPPLSLNFLDSRLEMCINSYKEFLCQYDFQLSLSFSRQNKELGKKFMRFMCFNFIFNIYAQIM